MCTCGTFCATSPTRRPARMAGSSGRTSSSLAKRHGAGRTVVATAHKILRIVFAMPRAGKPYWDPQIDYQARMAIKNKGRWLKMLPKANLLQ